MEQYGNTSTYNVESVLQKNIVGSEYYNKTCVKLEDWTQVVDEIWESVSDVEPWMSGNARGASTAFCLLYRLFTLKITEDEAKALLDHTDSPYIRAIGFLYLRYVGNPRTLWHWLQPYVKDNEEFTPSPEGFGKAVSIGDFVRDIFLEQYYFETIFPRIPKPVNDDFVSKLTAMGLPSRAVGNGGQGGADRRGVEDGNRRPASVKASLSVAFGQRAPNRATAREEGRGLGAGMKGASGQSRLDERDRERDRNRVRDRDRERDRDRDADRDRERRDRDRERSSRDDRHRINRTDRERERRHEQGSHRSDRDRERDRKRIRDDERRGDADRQRDGESHRDGKRSKEREASDVFKDRSGAAARPDRVREAYGDATRENGKGRERHSTGIGAEEEVYRIGR